MCLEICLEICLERQLLTLVINARFTRLVLSLFCFITNFQINQAIALKKRASHSKIPCTYYSNSTATLQTRKGYQETCFNESCDESIIVLSAFESIVLCLLLNEVCVVGIEWSIMVFLWVSRLVSEVPSEVTSQVECPPSHSIFIRFYFIIISLFHLLHEECLAFCSSCLVFSRYYILYSFCRQRRMKG